MGKNREVTYENTENTSEITKKDCLSKKSRKKSTISCIEIGFYILIIVGSVHYSFTRSYQEKARLDEVLAEKYLAKSQREQETMFTAPFLQWDEIEQFPVDMFHLTVENHFVSTEMFPNRNQIVHISVSENVQWIFPYAFRFCDFLTTIDFSEGLSVLGYGALGYCKGITEVILPNSLVGIDHLAFYRCENLQSVTIPSAVAEISPTAFLGTSPDLVIFGQENSFAQDFAREQGISFLVIPNILEDPTYVS